MNWPRNLRIILIWCSWPVGYEEPDRIKRVLNRKIVKAIVVSDQTREIHQSLRIEQNGNLVFPTTLLVDNTNTVVWSGLPKDLNSEIIIKLLDGELR